MHLTVKFIDKEYYIPQDVLTYIDLLNFTDSVQKQLVGTFIRKLKNEIAKGNAGLLGDKDLASEIEQQVGRFIAKLCDNGIYTRTISDYLKNNKGYQLYSNVNKAALNNEKELLIKEMEEWKAGYENAVSTVESQVTGLGFTVWSGSFVNHAIYAAMEASKLQEQSKEAEAQYQKDISDLRSRLNTQYGNARSNYINNTYIPNMESALTVFAYELLDKYVADLIAHGKFDSKTLGFVDIGRSNDLLKNLTLSQNKQAILETAFAACPYNIAVYMQAMNNNLLDYDAFQTAKVFKQDNLILSFLKESWGVVSFPAKFNINYQRINLWASFTGKTSEEILHYLTEQFAAGVVQAYSRVANIMVDKSNCREIIEGLGEKVILIGNSICIGEARKLIQPIVSTAIWEQLTEKCGHSDLLSLIKAYFPSADKYQTKDGFDKYVIEQLAASFEDIRKELVEQIEARHREKEQKERVQAERKAQKTAAVKSILIFIGVVVAICIALVIARIIILFETDKPIDEDFSQSYGNEEYLLDKEKIEYASKILGRRCDASGKISLNADLGNFINGDNPLFGEDGHFELGAYAADSKGLKIDTLDWVSNGKVNDFSKIVTALQALYGEPFYTIGDEYAWSDIGIYEEILCVRNKDKTVTIRWVYRVSDPENQILDENLKTDLEKIKEYASYIKGVESNVLKDYPHFEDDGDTYYQCEDQLFGISGHYKFEYFEGKISSVRFIWIPADWHNDEEYVVECLKKCFGDFTGYYELLDDEWFCYTWEDTTADNLKVSYYIAEDEGEIIVRVK